MFMTVTAEITKQEIDLSDFFYQSIRFQKISLVEFSIRNYMNDIL